MVSAYFGEENLYNAIVFDQVTFLMFSVLVVPLVLRTTSDKSSSNAMIFKRILTFPSFLATISALVVSQLIDYSVIYPLLDKILATLSPLALFSIGLQLRISD
jgi:predicted permease